MIFGTNLLTQSPVPVSVFPCFWISQKRKIKRSPIDLKLHGTYFWIRRSPEDLECKPRSCRGSHEIGGHAPPPVGSATYLVGPSGVVSHWFFFPKFTYIPLNISVSFYHVWTFDRDFLRNKKHATNRNWHWALDQYISPKNSIESCQKYMKVVEYWHGTIKNYRYDGDVSASPSLIPACPRVGKW